MIVIDRASTGLVLQADGPGGPDVVLGEWLGSGAEAEIFGVPGWQDGRWAAKVFHGARTTPQKELKLHAMMATPPRQLLASVDGEELPLLAWPERLLRRRDGQLAGFLMFLADPARTASLEDCTHWGSALDGADASLPQRLRLCRNLASIVAQLHGRGHRVVDFKPNNLRVHRRTGIPCLLDTDGFSIEGPDGDRHAALVATPEFSSPEVLRGQLAVCDVVDENHDRFALALILFEILNGGIHPFQGVLLAERVDAMNAGNIRDGLYAYGLAPHAEIAPTPGSRHESFPPALRERLDRALAGLPHERPAAADWREFLDLVLATPAFFARCGVVPKNELHIHFAGSPCPQCALEASRRRQRRVAAALARGALGNAAATARASAPPSANKPPARHRRARRVAAALVILVLLWLLVSLFTGAWPLSMSFVHGG